MARSAKFCWVSLEGSLPNKAADLCSKLIQAGAMVFGVVMTESAEQVHWSDDILKALTGRPVASTICFRPAEGISAANILVWPNGPIWLVVAPATANYLAEVAHGLAGDLPVDARF